MNCEEKAEKSSQPAPARHSERLNDEIHSRVDIAARELVDFFTYKRNLEITQLNDTTHKRSSVAGSVQCARSRPVRLMLDLHNRKKSVCKESSTCTW